MTQVNLLTSLINAGADLHIIEHAALTYLKETVFDTEIPNVYLCSKLDYVSVLQCIGTLQYETTSDYTILIYENNEVAYTIKFPVKEHGGLTIYDTKYDISEYIKNVKLNIHSIMYKLSIEGDNIVVVDDESNTPQIQTISGNDYDFDLVEIVSMMIKYEFHLSEDLLSVVPTKSSVVIGNAGLLELYTAMLNFMDLPSSIQQQIIEIFIASGLVNMEYEDSIRNIMSNLTMYVHDYRDFMYLMYNLFASEHHNVRKLLDIASADPNVLSWFSALSRLNTDDKSSIIDAILIDDNIVSSNILLLLYGEEFNEQIKSSDCPFPLRPKDLVLSYQDVIKIGILPNQCNELMIMAVKEIISDNLTNTTESLTEYFVSHKTERTRTSSGTLFDRNDTRKKRNRRKGSRYRNGDNYNYHRRNRNYDQNDDYYDYDIIN